MVSNIPPEGLRVSAVRQTCAAEVNEEGTEAPPPPMSFVADHPSMFAIVEYEKAEVLFLGHLMDPSQEK
jgi:serpin B